MRFPLLVAGSLLVLGAVPALGQDDLGPQIERVVDLPTPDRRAEAASELASTKGVTVEALLPLLREFGTFGKRLTGTQTIPLPLAGKGAGAHVYTPEGYDPAKPAPLLVTLHASGGDAMPGIHRWQTVADQLGMIVMSPWDGGPNQGFRQGGEGRAPALEALRRTRRLWNVDESRVFLTGISRGGHLTWDLALRHPDRFAGIAPMVGGPRWAIQRGQNNMRYLENLAWMPIRDLQGMKDDPGLVFNLEESFQKLERFGATDAKFHRFPDMGHSFDLGAVDWNAFFSEKRRPARPERVVRTVANLREARAFWVVVEKLGRKVKEQFQVKIDPRKWNGLDTAGKKRFMIRQAEVRTGRVEVRMTDRGVFVVKARDVTRIRLLLDAGMFTPGEPVRVSWNGRTVRKVPQPDAKVLLTDFAERFDRTFLPVAVVTVP